MLLEPPKPGQPNASPAPAAKEQVPTANSGNVAEMQAEIADAQRHLATATDPKQKELAQKVIDAITKKLPAAAAPAGKPAKKLDPKDQVALDWANSNPDDPRAAKIKARLGV